MTSTERSRLRMLVIDGSRGEGGGQVLRTALALSLVTGTPLRVEHIRARRAKPGLMRQHLTAVLAAAEIGGARVNGAEIRSKTLELVPGTVRPGEYTFSVGTAGSTALVFQTVLPALLRAGGPSTLHLEGGTHNPLAPTFDFLRLAFLPLLERMGARVRADLERPGFYPAGGGRWTARIEPAAELRPLVLEERGRVLEMRARAVVANLPRHIAEREAAVLARRLSIEKSACRLDEISGSPGPGNIVEVEVESEHVTEVFTGFGERGVPAEAVANRCAAEVREYLARDVPAGIHLADQLLIPMALAGSGSFITQRPSLHTTTNIAVIGEFLDVPIRIEELEAGRARIAAG